MAEVTVKTKKVKKVVYANAPVYILELTQFEAEALGRICRVVSGAQSTSRSVFSDAPDSILARLCEAGIQREDIDKHTISGSVTFHNTRTDR